MTTIYTTTFSLFLIGVSAQFNHENTQKKLHLDFSHSITLCADTFSLFLHQSFSSIQPFDHSICNHLQFVSSLQFQHNSTMQIPTKPHLDFSHSITLYAISFSSFLHQSFNTIQPCKYPQNFTWILVIRSPYMQSPSTHFFTKVSAQFSQENTHKTSLGTNHEDLNPTISKKQRGINK